MVVFFPGEASFANGFNLSQAVEWVVDGIAFVNIDSYFLESSGKAGRVNVALNR